MPTYVTIITPIEASNIGSCRQYLRSNAEPIHAAGGLQCRPQFRFDLIPNLHFASFLILDAERDFGPSLVFEATFDGPKEDFLSDLLRAARHGMDGLYKHCTGYPASALQTPELAKEYLVSHDVGADIYFSGSPGRTVAQIKGEHLAHTKIVAYFSWSQARDAFPPRLSGLFAVLRSFIAEKTGTQWAQQQAPVPWEVRFRTLIAIAAVITGLSLACLLGALLAAAFGLWPVSLRSLITTSLEAGGRFGSRIAAHLGIRISPGSAVFPVIGLAVVWLLMRASELFLSGWSKRPRDQFFIWRVPLHIAVILRYGALVFLAGAVLLALIPEMGGLASAVTAGLLLRHLLLLAALLLALLVLQYLATSLKLSVELKKPNARHENWYRLQLDLVRFAMVLSLAGCIAIISRYVPFVPHGNLATSATSLVYWALVIAAYGLVGILAAYAVGLGLLLLLRGRELLDKQNFDDPAILGAKAGINAAKYTREEGGNNRLQNHLASMTHVKPGLVRLWSLRVTLFAINLLSRFWFNIGELGGIPTILSARWVLIDGGRRLLFLDNYGGAWESYLNEFIDMTAVKGLNAIWSNTFVEANGRRCSFPETRFYFWKGAQTERPFKAYVRESQIETIAWYSAYPTLSVVNINTSTAIRQSLSKPLAACEIDTVIQNL